jgi:hypothetical protein
MQNGPEVPELEDNDASVANGDHAANGASVIDDSAYESMAAAIENLSTVCMRPIKITRRQLAFPRLVVDLIVLLRAQVQKSIREGYDELELLNHAQVIFGTLAVLGRTHGMALPLQLGGLARAPLSDTDCLCCAVRMGMRAVDVLVVDEAGQSTEAETCIAFLVCLAVVVLAMCFSHI